MSGRLGFSMPADFVSQTIRQASVSLTLGVFIGSALTSGIVFGIAAAWLANERVFIRLRSKALETFSAARDAVLSTREGQVLQRALLQNAEQALLQDTGDAAGGAAIDLAQPVSSFSDPRLAWSHENGEPGSTAGGRWSCEAGGSLVISPAPGRDYWCRTFYTPLLCKTDGQALLAAVAPDSEASLTTTFTLSPKSQFDQAGIMVLVDAHTWCKAGIEYVDGIPRLACVVTNNGFSDWSTSSWPGWDPSSQIVSARVRLSKLLPGAQQGGCLVFEAAPFDDTDSATPARWAQVRIASLREGAGRRWRMGVYAQSPVKQSGCTARFHHISLGPIVAPVHEAALPENHGGLATP
eukprot:CAMPEP_0119317334 /NCGR_PEP_ID=MMETSP1333-20130426/42816_1 /TAXON_ID=418940 /ORGANISM="Scyphosphaera apsteinii, Strain RCC1455" /LENGTH=351 /DNA_ID=CAMNT_0007323235 /DNA_START=20 /DNA_END=1075 /DNA_ORIENTATION=+